MNKSVAIAFFALSVTVFGQDIQSAEKLFWDQDYEQAEQVLRDLVA